MRGLLMLLEDQLFKLYELAVLRDRARLMRRHGRCSKGTRTRGPRLMGQLGHPPPGRAGAEGEEMSKGMPREWTKEEIRRLKLLADENISADYIVKLLNRSIPSVIAKGQWLNLSLARRLKAKGK